MSDIELPRVVPQLRPEKGLKKFAQGDVVFFKRVKETAQPHGRFQEFKGHGFGILLGAVPDKAPDPPIAFLHVLMGQHGWVTFDDVCELLSKAHMDMLLERFSKKYNLIIEAPKPTETTEAPSTPEGPPNGSS